MATNIDDLDILTFCPLDKKCREIKPHPTKEGKFAIIQCRWYKKIQGENPQTGEILDEYECAVGWVPILTTELIRRQVGTTAAVESFRNNVMATNTETTNLLTAQSSALLGRAHE